MQPLINLKSFLAVLLILIVPAALLVAYFRNDSPGTGGHEHGAPHKQGAPGQPHEKMQHERMQPSGTSGGHKHGAPGQTAEKAEKTPLPDTLEGTWKAIHEHHGQLESAVSAKKFSDGQSHAQSVSDLAKRLVELSHADHKPAVEGGVNKVNQALAALRQSAETGSELVMKNNFDEFAKALNELEQQMKKQ